MEVSRKHHMDWILKKFSCAVSQHKTPLRYPKTLKKQKIIDDLKKRIYRGKYTKDYVQVYEALYQLAKRLHNPEIRKAFEQHHRTVAGKIHTLAKGRRDILEGLNEIPIDKWRKVRVEDIPKLRKEILKLLDGTRIYVGEDLRDISCPIIDPQQTAATSGDAQQNHMTETSTIAWDWDKDAPASTGFEMTLEEASGLAESLTENDWSEWNIGE